MAALSGFVRRALVAALLAGAVLATPAPCQEPAPVKEADALVRAEQAFLDADFETALAAARQVADALAGREGAALDDATRARLARALDLVAQSLFNLGRESEARDALARLVAVEPGYRVDEALAGREFAALFESVRSERVGWIRLACRPLPCESVTVDGRRIAPPEDGMVALPAGTRTLVLSRHGFRDETVGGLEIAPGATLDVTVELTQVARDVVLRTEPSGVRVSIDGTPAGTTEPGAEPAGASAPLVLTEIAPGPHVLVLEAPCRRRVEQPVEIVLDARDPGPLDLGVIPLAEARAQVTIDWTRDEGTVLIDGAPAAAGTHTLCPGVHELAVAVGTRRIWVERVTLADGEQRRFAPRPRPGIALPPALVAGLSDEVRADWNVLTLAPAVRETIARTVREALGEDPPAIAPRVARRTVAALQLASWPPDAALAGLVVDGVGPLGRHRVAVLVDPRRGLVEASAPERGAPEVAALDAALARRWRPFGSYLGLDLVLAEGRGVLVAAVAKDSPAAGAGLATGMRVVSLAGRPPSGPADLDALREAPPAGPVAIEAAGRDAVATKFELVPTRQLRAPSPAALAAPGRALLGLLARAEVLRAVGDADQRAAALVWSGLLLAALGRDAEAVEALDRAAVPAELDPSTDARATVGYALWRLLARLGDPYADEVRARLAPLAGARAGGRAGPPLEFVLAGSAP
ncbi:MAG: hypothetical protein D6738_08165 [Acidobacteria bacterium]|nr:MAG: hypothetical protein D6738_08165 [Acidobacteriota bacterium]